MTTKEKERKKERKRGERKKQNKSITEIKTGFKPRFAVTVALDQFNLVLSARTVQVWLETIVVRIETVRHRYYEFIFNIRTEN